jgi:ankyrin repeat protein
MNRPFVWLILALGAVAAVLIGVMAVAAGRTVWALLGGRPLPGPVPSQADPMEPELRDAEGWTRLMRAAQGGSYEAVSSLLSCGADPTLENPDGDRAAELAARAGYPHVASLLRQACRARR